MAVTAAERLVEAKAAYHTLMTGRLPVEVRDANGETVRFTFPRRADLQTYIKELEAEVAGTSVTRRPMRPVFG